MKGLRGSFLGFTYNNVHSSVLGITRTEKGESQKKLIPDLKDVYVDKPYADGQYWYGQTYSKRDFTINFAFEEITDVQLSRMRALWGDKQIHNLIFDEEPYKVYSAKVTGSTMLKHLPFDVVIDGVTTRVYRGEGSLTLTCYFPFARSRYPYIEDYTVGSVIEWISDEEEALNGDLERGGESNYAELSEYFVDSSIDESALITDEEEGAFLASYEESKYVNLLEWKDASRLPSKRLYPLWSEEECTLYLYNAGDIETPFKIYYSIEECQKAIEEWGSFVLGLFDDATLSSMSTLISLVDLTAKSVNYIDDTYIEIDMKEGLVCGCDSTFKRTGTLYNEMMDLGSEFFLLPKGRVGLWSDIEPAKIDIYYLYL